MRGSSASAGADSWVGRLSALALFGASLWPNLTWAQALVPVVVNAQGVSEVAMQKLQRAMEAQLKALSGLSVAPTAVSAQGAPRRCDEACATQVVRGLAAPAVLLLEATVLEPKTETLVVHATFVLDGEAQPRRRFELPRDGFESTLRVALESVLPRWGRKGYAGLRLDLPPGTAVRVDGRLTPAKPGEVLTVTAGVHQVDVVFPDGNALLQRINAVEGSRARVEAVSPAATLFATAPQGGALRAVSYTLWMAGALAVAGGLVAGTLSRTAAVGLSPCRADSRDCATLDVALERQRQARGYVETANVLIAAGGGMLVAGATLFTIDSATP